MFTRVFFKWHFEERKKVHSTEHCSDITNDVLSLEYWFVSMLIKCTAKSRPHCFQKKPLKIVSKLGFLAPGLDKCTKFVQAWNLVKNGQVAVLYPWWYMHLWCHFLAELEHSRKNFLPSTPLWIFLLNWTFQGNISVSAGRFQTGQIKIVRVYLCSLWDYIVTFAKLLSFAGKSCDSNADSACQLQGLKSQIRPWFFSLLAKWERRRESCDKNSLAGKSRPGGGFMSRIHLAKVGVMKTKSDFVNL